LRGIVVAGRWLGERGSCLCALVYDNVSQQPQLRFSHHISRTNSAATLTVPERLPGRLHLSPVAGLVLVEALERTAGRAAVAQRILKGGHCQARDAGAHRGDLAGGGRFGVVGGCGCEGDGGCLMQACGYVQAP